MFLEHKARINTAHRYMTYDICNTTKLLAFKERQPTNPPTTHCVCVRIPILTPNRFWSYVWVFCWSRWECTERRAKWGSNYINKKDTSQDSFWSGSSHRLHLSVMMMSYSCIVCVYLHFVRGRSAHKSAKHTGIASMLILNDIKREVYIVIRLIITELIVFYCIDQLYNDWLNIEGGYLLKYNIDIE